ncbi:MarR family winged helix-turn-helix transcriptional regulator [Streptomyces sp. SAJ15]|uniref:MarR family winged helix-turn-helix transcriptional regulator n=1 Tax=Streptomyces sp. SAJ15 TaxID=2011095 RepID=UPI001185F23F|nr:MarR family transcriptional regulator [Streptomyces sp. SAJ15]TVL90563.1 MarR family transcriptional regulator [Streptomyces sp. SAJ15]
MSASTPPPAQTPTKIELLELLAALGMAQWRDFSAAAVHHGLTGTQAKVLSQLGRGPLPMRALAERLVCDASNITGIVDRLEDQGLVRREPSPTDRRVKNVVATDKGRETLLRVRTEMQATHSALDTLDAAETETLFALLNRLRPSMERTA